MQHMLKASRDATSDKARGLAVGVFASVLTGLMGCGPAVTLVILGLGS